MNAQTTEETGQNNGIGATVAEGFPGQRLSVLPRPLVQQALARPGTSRLVVTDCGYFPQARAHGRARPDGIPQVVVIVCSRGAGWCVVDGVCHDVRAGEVVVLPPDTPHSYGAHPDDPWTVWWFHAAGAGLGAYLGDCDLNAVNPVRNLRDVYKAVSLIEEVVQWAERDSTHGSLLAAAGAAWHLLAQLGASPSVRNNRATVIEQAKDYLRDNSTERISVADLAARANMSPSHFAALFREYNGDPVLRYQTQLRMARARELLDTTDQPVSMISRLVGYPDPFYFTRQFKSIHGTTPLRYRAQHKG